jgi:nucleotide-binding universal stress UspA family protein
MLRSILVPLDGSDFSERSLPLAGEVARASGAHLHLAHVHIPHEPEHLIGNTSFQYEGIDFSEYEERQLRREREYLANVEKKFDGDGTLVDSALLEGGSVVDELAEYARRVDTDIIFITSHAYAGLKRAWLGSTMEEVLRRTGSPILVVHPPREELDAEPVTRLRHFLVPLDGSPLAESVLGPAVDLARATGARMTLLRVLNEPVLLGPRIQPIMPDRLEPDRTLAVDYLERLAEDLRKEGLDVRVEAREGNSAARTIAEVAEDLEADLIALATHGYGGLRRTLAGSVADTLLHRVRLPMLLIRPPFLA